MTEDEKNRETIAFVEERARTAMLLLFDEILKGLDAELTPIFMPAHCRGVISAAAAALVQFSSAEEAASHLEILARAIRADAMPVTAPVQ